MFYKIVNFPTFLPTTPNVSPFILFFFEPVNTLHLHSVDIIMLRHILFLIHSIVTSTPKSTERKGNRSNFTKTEVRLCKFSET